MISRGFNRSKGQLVRHATSYEATFDQESVFVFRMFWNWIFLDTIHDKHSYLNFLCWRVWKKNIIRVSPFSGGASMHFRNFRIGEYRETLFRMKQTKTMNILKRLYSVYSREK